MNSKSAFGPRLSLLLLFSVMASAMFAQQPAPLPSPYPGGTPVNYARVWDAVKPETNAANISTAVQPSDHRMTTMYMDGLGRDLQTVVKQGALSSVGGNNVAGDLVSSKVYDVYGRESMTYLPFSATGVDGSFKTNPFQQQAAFYNGQLSGQAGETYVGVNGLNWAYSNTKLELSQTGRPLEIFAPGAAWVGSNSLPTEAARHSVKFKYCLNTSADQVVIWEGTTPSGFYPANELAKTITIDEHNKQVIEFKDKTGHILLKKVQLTGVADNGSGTGYSGWLCTYYIYDKWNMLTHVIQPNGVQVLYDNSWPTPVGSPSLWTSLLDEQCFKYEYDGRGRMISKKVPGSAVVQMVYDARDRLVLTQDGNQRQAQQWMYTQYDEFNRPIATGLIDDPANYANPAWHRTQAAVSTSYPALGSYVVTVFTETFYDNYAWLSGHGNPFTSGMFSTSNSLLLSPSNTIFPYPQPLTQGLQTTGLVTGTRVRVLGTSQYLYAINYYDDKGRMIQQIGQNVTGGIFRNTTQYSFSGQVLQTLEFTKKGSGGDGQEFTVHTRNTLDVLGRVITVSKELYTYTGAGNSGEKVVAKFEYDALGRVKKKVIAPYMNAGAGLESQVMDYNVREWTLGVNRNYLSGSSSALFGYELGYDQLNNQSGKAFQGGTNNGEFNGNINGMVWKSKGDGTLRKYDFKYDAANRLLKGEFEQKETGKNWDPASVNYTVQMGDGINPGSAYDPNGNILAMKQYGWKLGGSSNPIDDLVYDYLPGSNRNRLHYVRDLQNDPTTKLGDFHDGVNAVGSADYDYDFNGNLTLDHNKGISQISYNHLNLPSVITVSGKGTITYSYDAAGNKLKKEVLDQTVVPAVATTTYYLGNIIFKDNQLEVIQHSEGRIRFVEATASTCPPLPSRFVFDYYVKDHLGSVRMVLTDQQQNICYLPATMEDARYNTEVQLYDINNGRRIDKTVAGAGGQASFEDKVYRVHGGLTGEKTGLGITLKVMSGDQVSIYGESFYSMPGGGPGLSAGLTLTELLTAFTSSGTLLAAGHGGVTSGAVSNAGSNASTLPLHLGAQSEGVGNARAFLNWILFDEQFKFVDGSADEVKPGGGFKPHVKFINTPVPVTKNGFLYIYVSNESNLPVYFDNLTVTHTPGSLLEESHYYPFGLTMAGISSKALAFGGPENKKKYQQYEFNSDFDINLYESFYRTHDPQIGRFLQIDSRPNELISPYAAMNNNPISNFDPLGDTSVYYTSDGKHWFTSPDKLENAVVVIPKDNEEAFFSHFARKYSGVKEEDRDYNTMNTDLRTYGASYSTEEYFAYYDNNAGVEYNSKKGKYEPVDGKGPLTVEHAAATKLKNGYVRIDQSTSASGDPTTSSPNKGEMGVHTHTNEGRKAMFYRTEGYYQSGEVYTGRQGLGMDLNGGQKGDASKGNFRVVVTPTHMYLYAQGKLYIAVDRKLTPSKNPGEIK